MKDLLIVLTPHSDKHFEICNTIAKEIEAKKIQLQRPLETAFLASGPKSFEAAIMCHEICQNYKIPYAIFEIEAVLSAPFVFQSKDVGA